MDNKLSYSCFKSYFCDIPDFPSEEEFKSISRYKFSSSKHLEFGYTCYSLLAKFTKSNKLNSINLLKINIFNAQLRKQLKNKNDWYLIGFRARDNGANDIDRYMKSYRFESSAQLEDARFGYYDNYFLQRIIEVPKDKNNEFFAIISLIELIGKADSISDDERVSFLEAINAALYLPFEDRYFKYKDISKNFPNCSRLFQFRGGVFNRSLGTDSHIYDIDYLPMKVFDEQCGNLLRKLVNGRFNVIDFLNDVNSLFFSDSNTQFNKELFLSKYGLENSEHLLFVLNKIKFNSRFKQMFINAFDNPQLTNVDSTNRWRS